VQNLCVKHEKSGPKHNLQRRKKNLQKNLKHLPNSIVQNMKSDVKNEKLLMPMGLKPFKKMSKRFVVLSVKPVRLSNGCTELRVHMEASLLLTKISSEQNLQDLRRLK